MMAAFAALLLLATMQGEAQPRPDPNCRDDRGTDRCAETEQRRMRELYGVRSIEEHQAAGDQVRRIFYVDGYGRDLILIAFVRTSGRRGARANRDWSRCRRLSLRRHGTKRSPGRRLSTGPSPGRPAKRTYACTAGYSPSRRPTQG